MTQLPLTRLGKTDFSVSKLGLGTAEIGFAYGLGEMSLPSEEDALALLNRARTLGVTFYDTANYYGLAEERLGKSGISTDPAMVVCTKGGQFLEKGEVLPYEEIESLIREQVAGSLKTLNISKLQILLLHGPTNTQLRDEKLLDILAKIKEEGLVGFIGASTRGEEAALALIETGKADVIEVAFNIADQRMTGRVLPLALERGIGVINRSIYLKGVFAGRAGNLPAGLEVLQVVVAKAQSIADTLQVSLPELALRFALSEPAIATTLVGTVKEAHLSAAAEAISKGPLPPDVVAQLRSLALLDSHQVDPARWPK